MRTFLRSIDEASLRRLCELSMLTHAETDILASLCSRRQDMNFIADKHNISVSTLHRRVRQAVKKVRFRLGIRRGFSEAEIIDRVEEALAREEDPK